MTYDEARKLLGLAPGDGGREVRRAYLRLLKVHRPERDPEGFKRLREALELLQTGAAWEPSPPTEAEGEAPEPQLATSSLPDDLHTRLLALDDDADKLRLVREAAHSEQTPSAYTLWFETADEVGDEDEARAALRAAVDRGHMELHETLRRRFPEALDERELEAWCEESKHAPSAGWPQLASTLIERGRVGQAVEVGLSALARSVELPGVVEEWSSLDLALQLLSSEPLSAPLRFARALLARSGAFSSTDPMRFTLLSELTRVADRMPELLVNEIARALRAHDPGQADNAIVLFGDSDRRAGRRMRVLLEAEAPALFQIYQNVLLPAPAWSWSWKDFSLLGALRVLLKKRAGVIWPVIIALNLLRLCAASGSHKDETLSAGALDAGSVSISMRPLANGTEYLSCTPFNHVFCIAANSWWQASTCAERLRGADGMERSLPRVQEYLNQNEKALVSRIVHETRTRCAGGGVVP